MILSDFDLRNYIRSGRLVIKPYVDEIVRENGVDLRFGDSIARMKALDKPLDVRADFDVEEYYQIERGSSFTINPDDRILACTHEWLEMPSDLMGFVELRSTHARMGLALPPTIIDANFKGQLTLEILGGRFPVKVYKGDRFAHIIFAKLTSAVEKPYSGKYQGQKGVTLPRLDARVERTKLRG